MVLDKRTVDRCKKLHGIGLVYNGAEYINGDINIHWTEISFDSDKEFNTKIEKIEAEIERRENA